jgi:hypothetical protein
VPLVQTAGGSFYGNSLCDLLANTLAAHVFASLGPYDALAAGRFWAKSLTRGLFLVYLVWEARAVWRASALGPDAAVLATIRASVRALLTVSVLVLTWVLTWYFTWPLALAVFLGWRSTLTRVAVACSLTCLPFIYLKHYWADAMPDWLVLLYLVLPLLALRHPIAVDEQGREDGLQSGEQAQQTGLGGRVAEPVRSR